MNVVFDFGAVLFTWRPADIVADVFPERAGTEADARQLAHAVFSHQDWHNFDRGLMEMDNVISRTASRLRLDPARLQALVYSIGERLQPMQDTVAVLRSLHDRRQLGERAQSESGGSVRGLYFLSNMPVPYARELEQKHAFLGQFDGGIFSGDVLCSKPDPGIYSLLQSRYGLVPGSTVFIDDLKANVDAARALGWAGIHFTSAEQLTEELKLQCSL
ncbi:haloacid dehalogenase [Rhodoferax lacus]|uniref:Haloacid dehalogenase n=1 Tax=Rhodoferax lacus TaxID=2184758 RepID=A0A3E1RE34_9BURK|nr:HAD family phosphatase [Rhodoferax lacus]RFO97491.1 haloacid dehalogenase [Rhodoferax lacus]